MYHQSVRPDILPASTQSGFPNEPHFPSSSAMADTVITPGLLAGEKDDASIWIFPAATTYATFFAIDSFSASSNAVDLHLHPKL